MDFINELQQQEESAANAGSSDQGMMDRIRRASAATLYKKAEGSSTDQLRLSKIGAGAADAYNDVNQFANTAAVIIISCLIADYVSCLLNNVVFLSKLLNNVVFAQ
jgi:hypothetical protein